MSIETQNKKERDCRIDVLKGIAIIAVVFYHLCGDYIPFGYLGVDIFLVIGGFLTVKSMLKSIKNEKFSAWNFLKQRIIRLLPMLVIVSMISMIFGYFLMLPDDYENLSQSVIASIFFSNNILSCITTSNYWDIANVFKPLMHTWYLGVLVQGYVLLAVVFAIVNKAGKKKEQILKWCCIAMTGISFIVFLLPYFSDAAKFYYLPFRLFELTGGGIVAFFSFNVCKDKKTLILIYILQGLSLITLLVFLFVPFEALNCIKIIVVVLITIGFLCSFSITEDKVLFGVKGFSYVGKSSLSIYLWHQPIVAFLYYSFVGKLSMLSLLIFILLTAGISVLGYIFIETALPELFLNKGRKKRKIVSYVVSAALILCTFGGSGLVYLNAGVVRDVPELGIQKGAAHRGMHAEYGDRPYDWNKDFSTEDKVKVLVIGNSYGRDWANVLYESTIKDFIEISYIYPYSVEYIRSKQERFNNSDYIFYVLGPGYAHVPEYIVELADLNKLYLVGNKGYGTSNGIIYKNRVLKDYLKSTVKLEQAMWDFNLESIDKYGNHYIDMLTPIADGKGNVRVFTPGGQFISQDCRHLTKYGAMYYAELLDLTWIIN